MVATALEESVLECEFGEGAELVVIVLLRVAADDVVGLLLPLVDAEPLESLLALRDLGATARGVEIAQVGGHACALVVGEGGQLEAGVVALGIAVVPARVVEVVALALDLGEVAVEGAGVGVGVGEVVVALRVAVV